MDINKKIKAAQSREIDSKSDSKAKRPGKSERRKFQRYELACPVALYFDALAAPEAQARSRTDNISDGGCYVTVAQTADMEYGSVVRLDLKVPRQTPNTYLLEPFHTDAYIVRIDPGKDVKTNISTGKETTERGLALKFTHPLELSLE